MDFGQEQEHKLVFDDDDDGDSCLAAKGNVLRKVVNMISNVKFVAFLETNFSMVFIVLVVCNIL